MMSSESDAVSQDGTLIDEFSQIPFRVIIYDILPFHEIEVGKIKNEYELYGYFRNDSQRKVFFLFHSVLFCHSFFKKDVHSVMSMISFPHSKVERVTVRSKISETSRKIESVNFSNMKSLESFTLKISDYELEALKIGKKILSVLTLPHLRKIHIETRRTLCGRNWHKFDFNHIESFHLSCRSLLLDEENIFGLKSLKNVKFFSLRSCTFEKMTEFHLPSLRSLSLDSVEKVDISHGGNITKMKLRECEVKLCEKLILQNPNIYDLTFRVFPSRSRVFDEHLHRFLFEGSLQNCLRVRIVGVEIPKLETTIKLNPDIRTLSIFHCNVQANFDFIDSIFQSSKIDRPKYSSLNCLRIKIINSSYSLSSQFCPILSQLLSLELVLCEFLTDSLFQQNEFLVLRSLEIGGCHNLIGKNWPVFPQLKTLMFERMDNLEETPFMSRDAVEGSLRIKDVSERFPELQELDLRECKKIKGEKWGVFPKVKHLKIYWCAQFRDFAFQDMNRFPSIETLYFRMCHSLNGVNWFPEFTRRVKSIWMGKCGKFKGSMFSEENSFPLLESLSFYKVYNLEVSEEWIGVRNLKELDCEECNVCDIQFQGQCMKSLVSIEFEECWAVKVENWSYLPNLESFAWYSRRESSDHLFKGGKPYGENTREVIHGRGT